MTQIIGIICKDYVLIASESQYAIGDKKRVDAQKISAIRFKDGRGIIVAEGGAVRTSNKIVAYIVEMAKDVSLGNAITVETLVESAIKKMRVECISNRLNQSREMTEAELEAFFCDRRRCCGLMIGVFDQGRPHLYTIYLHQEHIEKQTLYCTVGCDNDFANYTLRQFKWDTMEWKEAFPILIGILDGVNNDHINCAGQIRVWGIPLKLNSGIPICWRDQTVNGVVSRIRALQERQNRKFKADCKRIMEQMHVKNIVDRIKGLAEDYFPERRRTQAFFIGLAKQWRKERPSIPTPDEGWIGEKLSSGH